MSATGDTAHTASRPPAPAPPSPPAHAAPSPSPPAPQGHEGHAAAHEVDRLARAVALLWLEVESGRRRPAAVAHLLSHELWQRLRDGWVRGGPPGRLVRLLVHRHSATLCDAVAVVARGERTGAITFRLRHRGGGWCVVEAGVPERHGAR